ncbi:hypothetical protein CSKR_111959 [Clonorchis sinensis]|uniref:Uncharacterized protein n=2 Tax=Clonorchis sinensis TaxID=79923 RepID=A0A8T1M946_CLOSI|nr:hypothetical protein CSKR_111959 [Clonorchis sinensis]
MELNVSHLDRCEVCDITFTSKQASLLHNVSAEHHVRYERRQRALRKPIVHMCSFCGSGGMGGLYQWQTHVRGKRHQKALRRFYQSHSACRDAAVPTTQTEESPFNSDSETSDPPPQLHQQCSSEAQSDSSPISLVSGSGSVIHIWSLPPASSTGLNCSASSKLVQSCKYSRLAWDPCESKLISLQTDPLSAPCIQIRSGDLHNGTDVYNLFDDELAFTSGITRTSRLSATCFAFPLRGSSHQLAVGRTDGKVDVYGLSLNRLSLQIRIPCRSSFSVFFMPTCITWALCDRLLVIGTRTGDICVCLAPDGENNDPSLSILPVPQANTTSGSQETSCLTVCTSRLDTTLVAAGYSTGQFVVWRLDWPLSLNTLDHVYFQYFIPRPDSCSCELFSITWSLSTSHTLFTSGSPDLRLRIWKVERQKPMADPIHTLSTSEPGVGYLSNDVTVDGLTLATSLTDGRIWLYDVRSMSTPFCTLASRGSTPVQFLLFLNHVTSPSGTDNLNPMVNCFNTVGGKESGRSLKNLTNIEHGFSPQHSNKRLCLIPDDSSDRKEPRDSDSPIEFDVSSKSESNPSYQTKEAISSGMSSQPPPGISPIFDSDDVPDHAVNCLKIPANKSSSDARLDKVVYQLYRLERRVEKKLAQLSSILLELREENAALRRELEKRICLT